MASVTWLLLLRHGRATAALRRATARSRRAALLRRADGGWQEASPTGDGEVRLGARGKQPTSEREKPPRGGGAPASNGEPAEAACLQ